MYYVTMIRDRRTAWLAGPYSTHEDALRAVPEAKERALEIDPFHCFDWFGTARAETERKTAFGVL